MIRTVLKYVYAVIATPLAIAGERIPTRNRERKERRGYEPRPPLEAGEHRANELFNNPLRTVLLMIVHQIIFLGGVLSALLLKKHGKYLFLYDWKRNTRNSPRVSHTSSSRS